MRRNPYICVTNYTIMRLIITLILAGAVSTSLAAQKIEGSVTATSRDDLLSKLPAEVAYALPEFTSAQIFYINGTRFESVINICNVDNTVRYIDDNGDTLVMANASTVNKILVDEILYTQTNGYFVKVLGVFGQITLAERALFTFTEPEINTSYSNLPKSSSAQVFNTREMSDNSTKYDTPTEIPYKLETRYILYKKGKGYTCRLSAFTKLFPEKKKDIKEFVKNNKTDFSNKEDIMSLFAFCSGMLQ